MLSRSRLASLPRFLETLDIPYIVMGSLASSAYDVYRATADGDGLADLVPNHAADLASALGSGWYVDVGMMERSIRERRCFSLIHIATAQKKMLSPQSAISTPAKTHGATLIRVFAEHEAAQFTVASPEDVRRPKSSGTAKAVKFPTVNGATLPACWTNPNMESITFARGARLRVLDLLTRPIADARLQAE